MPLLQLQRTEGTLWLHVTPAKGPVAAINIPSINSPERSIVRRALIAALEEQSLPMETKKTFFTGTSAMSFRRGEKAEVVGVFYVTPKGADPRACFALRYADGVKDFHPVSDTGNYELSSE